MYLGTPIYTSFTVIEKPLHMVLDIDALEGPMKGFFDWLRQFWENLFENLVSAPLKALRPWELGKFKADFRLKTSLSESFTYMCFS